MTVVRSGAMSRIKALAGAGAVALVLASCAAHAQAGESTGLAAPVTTTGESSDANSYPVFAAEHTSEMLPSLSDVGGDTPRPYQDGCHLKRDQHTISPDCIYGSGDGPVVAVFGDSHAAQWIPALLDAADGGDLTVVSLTASACPSLDLTLSSDAGRANEDCAAWRDAALAYLHDVQPDVVLSSTMLSHEIAPGIDSTPHHRSALEEFLASMPTNSRVVWMADTPRFASNPRDCIRDHPTDLARCAGPREDVLDLELASIYEDTVTESGALYVDFTDRICDEQECGVAVGDLLVYRDIHHLNATFSRTFASDLVTIVRDAAAQ